MIGSSNLLPRLPVGKRKKSMLRSSAAVTLSRFARETEGNMSILALAGSMLMLVFGGVGIDMMLAEVERTKIQNTLDGSALAAANLEQRLDPYLVVEDHFDKMLLGDTLTSIDVNEGLNYRTVTVEAHRNFPANFLKLLNVDVLQAGGTSQAEERIQNIEISLILDISGSMGSNQKIENLRSSAKEFVTTVLNGQNSGLTTISIVPYNATVNLGPRLAPHFTLTDEHEASSCVRMYDADFLQTGISPSSELQRLAHFDPYSLDENSVQTTSSWCPTDDYGAILPHSNDLDELVAHIETLGAGGNTAIDLGMKWGVALLDPAARPVVSGLIGDGHVVSEASGRPGAYDAIDVLKIAVVMTDGMNTTQYDLKPKYNGGDSDIWIDDRGDNDPYNDRFSHRVSNASGTSNDVYYLERFKNGSSSDRYANEPDGGSNARRMSNAEVFQRWGTRAFGNKFFRKPYQDGRVSYSEYYNAYYSYGSIVSGSQADARLSNICEKARDTGITVFSIGFEAPEEGQAAMRNCASSPAHYFPVEGLEISDAFKAIARTINQLRLTQ
ncbi:pilus assembly protein TadG-related protein [Marivita sp. S2033]|uniref:pilus assembly protein TadG-related protein n=1 Tax=Marivita sp. S2033 TaxID=3373187 RepID=UPI003981ED6E